MERAYTSKVDLWIGAILLLGCVVPPILVGLVAISSHQLNLIPFGFISPLIIVALAIPVRYLIGERELVVQSGFLRVKIPYESIRSVEPSRSSLSSPALSLDRLAIAYEKGTVLVSPADRYGFLSDLQAKTGLERYGETLRKGSRDRA